MSQKTMREIALAVKDRFTIHGCHPDKFVPLGFLEEYAAAVLAEYLAQQEPLTYLRFRAGRSYAGHGDIEYNEWLEECLCTDKGDDGQPAVAVFLAPPIPAGMQLVPVPIEEVMLSTAGLFYRRTPHQPWRKCPSTHTWNAHFEYAKESRHAE